MPVSQPSPRRPRLVSWLALGVLSLAVIYLTRMVLGLNLPPLPFAVPTWYIPLTGGIWGTVALVDALALFRAATWAPKITRIGAAAYLSWYWLDRLLLYQSGYHRSTWPLALAISLIGLAAVMWGLNRPTVRNYFEEKAT